jgi:hypothetical protein
MQQLLDGLKVKALALFADIDTDGNGVIDREEFLVAMQQLQHALSDGEMALVFGCMESNGCITPQQVRFSLCFLARFFLWLGLVRLWLAASDVLAHTTTCV